MDLWPLSPSAMIKFASILKFANLLVYQLLRGLFQGIFLKSLLSMLQPNDVFEQLRFRHVKFGFARFNRIQNLKFSTEIQKTVKFYESHSRNRTNHYTVIW